jgi:predicted nucleic acid-binding protein
MSFLIDTCCISELIKPKPDASVIRWFSDHDEERMYLSVLTLGELRKGIEKLADSKRKDALSHWLEHDVTERFVDRILDITALEAQTWGEVMAHCARQGLPIPDIDGLLAASAIANGLTLVTRNTKDMIATGVSLIDPWSDSA